MQEFNLETYLNQGIENMIKGILKASLKNPKASLFFMQYAKDSRKAEEVRKIAAKRGEHVPAFLIASITTQCNLHCKGCYARANHSCFDGEREGMPRLLSAEKWKEIFAEAAELGIGFILLIGGEPFVRKDVLLAAGEQKNLLFPIFTNGTMITGEYLELLKKNRNLLPVLSIEGGEKTTDERRGKGVYHLLQYTMQKLEESGILYGASVTVHKENMEEVLSDDFITGLASKGCKAVIYVEYVPTTEESKTLALGEKERVVMAEHLSEIRARWNEMIFVSFPGDEKSSGGCLAAGRGFFHINAYGGAEPCPFSPYSDTSLTDIPLKEALKSPLFMKLQQNGELLEEHIGGCVLYEKGKQVKALLEGESV